VTRKANVRSRLKKVDAVIEAVRASGVECGSLVCSFEYLSLFVTYTLGIGACFGIAEGARDAGQGQVHRLLEARHRIPEGYSQGAEVDTGASGTSLLHSRILTSASVNSPHKPQGFLRSLLPLSAPPLCMLSMLS
jgi:hypothetical protein